MKNETMLLSRIIVKIMFSNLMGNLLKNELIIYLVKESPGTN